MNQLEIKTDEGNKDLLFLFWKDDLWKIINKHLFVSKLRPLFFVESLQDLEVLFHEIEEKSAKVFALKCLSKKNLLNSELRKKMEGKRISDESISKVLEFCQSIGCLKDLNTIEYRIEKELRKGKGFFSVKAKWHHVDQEQIFWNSPEKREIERQSVIKLASKHKDRKDLFFFLLKKRLSQRCDSRSFILPRLRIFFTILYRSFIRSLSTTIDL